MQLLRRKLRTQARARISSRRASKGAQGSLRGNSEHKHEPKAAQGCVSVGARMRRNLFKLKHSSIKEAFIGASYVKL